MRNRIYKTTIFVFSLMLVVGLQSCSTRKNAPKRRYKKVRDCNCSKFSDNMPYNNDKTYRFT